TSLEVGLFTNENLDNGTRRLLIIRNTNDSAEDDSGRTIYGYRNPRPPFHPIEHTSHKCTIESEPGRSEEINFPTAMPHLIIIGVQKSGTTTLQKILDNEPNMVKPSFKRQFETHFFDMDLRITDKKIEFTESQLCQHRKTYSEYFNSSSIQSNVSVVFEKTPSYIMYPSIAQTIDQICTWKPKLFAILRNPVDRAWSQIQMDHRYAEPEKLLAIFDGAVNELVTNGFLKGPFIDRSDDDRLGTLSLGRFLKRNSTTPFQFQDFTLKQYAELFAKFNGRKKQAYLLKGLYAPQLLPWVQLFSNEDRLMVKRFEQFIHEENNGVRTTLSELMEFSGLPDTHRTHVMPSPEPRQYVKRCLTCEPIPSKVREYLTHLYLPFNDLLPELLGEEWRDVW
ncbi:hypothetical protein ACHAXS_003179, partial [Conticribra weissflogii]